MPAMTKKRSEKESLDAWREAEKAYHKLVDPFLSASDGAAAKLNKDAAVAVAKARTKADHRREDYFKARMR